MKTIARTLATAEGHSAPARVRPGDAPRGAARIDGGPRGEVIRRLLADGPSTATSLAAALGISGTAVRRHLEALVAEGSVTSREESPVVRRGRGRPARVYLLTDVGRQRLPQAYDELATDALDYLARHGGPEAVEAFARQRAERIVDQVRPELDRARSVAERMRILAGALTGSGFAASIRDVAVGRQLSQHHCPVSHVAARYPQLCEQELAVFTEVLGTYAQRLATIARGDSFCTTFVPDAPAERIPGSPHATRSQGKDI